MYTHHTDLYQPRAHTASSHTQTCSSRTQLHPSLPPSSPTVRQGYRSSSFTYTETQDCMGKLELFDFTCLVFGNRSSSLRNKNNTADQDPTTKFEHIDSMYIFGNLCTNYEDSKWIGQVQNLRNILELIDFISPIH